MSLYCILFIVLDILEVQVGKFLYCLMKLVEHLSNGELDCILTLYLQDQALSVVAAYGSSKDITVYTNIGLKPDQIFIVGKTSKKQQAIAQVS